MYSFSVQCTSNNLITHTDTEQSNRLDSDYTNNRRGAQSSRVENTFSVLRSVKLHFISQLAGHKVTS